MSDGPLQPWREGIDADRRRRPRRPRDQRQTLRRITTTAAAAAVGLNAILFAQTGIAQLGPGELQGAIVSAVNAFFPGANLQPPSQTPSPAAGPPVVTTGAS
jgi:hypothetical protein